MVKNLKLGTKIGGGFIIVLVLLGVVAYVGYNGLSGVTDRVDKADDTNSIIQSALEARRGEKDYMLRGHEKYIGKVSESLDAIKKQALETKDKFKDTVDKQAMDEVLTAVDQYEKAFGEYVEVEHKVQSNIGHMVENARKLIAAAETIRDDQKKELEEIMATGNAGIKDKMTKADDANRLIKWALESRRSEKDYLLRRDKKYIDRVHRMGHAIVNLAEDMKSRFGDADDKQLADRIIAASQDYRGAFDEVVSLKEEQEGDMAQIVAAARNVLKVSDEATAGQKAKMAGQISSANSIMLVGTALAIILGSLLAFFITRGITKPLNRVIEGLNEGAEQVSSASGQVSSSSQQLAEGASEQAASIEETSSSLEEMASMTQQNADNANEAKSRMVEAGGIVKNANKNLGDMTRAITKITRSSEETGKIIKTIDEIAFQTNLLALNAAVEAARAGEAGAGFAVVADEVRNLAMRAGDAARNTSELIEGTIAAVRNGNELTQKTQEGFDATTNISMKIGELVDEIAAASTEQAQGIDQVNTAVAEMDKVVQHNAANAEESASASEEMNAQAEQMQAIVGDLVAIVGGAANNGGGNGRKSIVRLAEVTPFKALHAPAGKAKTRELVVH